MYASLVRLALIEGVLRAAIEELLLPGAGAEQRDTLRTFDSLEEASTEHYLEDRTLY